ncbi:GlsB/YeaQ/YmgE family stress response membrane protein [Mangrovibrevibacter kandeliae]|uniref:GlsB/YeaQ/YmgE family stress response membrane protein n=1 Tax=Mangrovibrevibacter kandeliae TaxID=2968473 RepID=UPI00211887C3|nr:MULTISPECIES: GlsB/YeaQ/YmgE family stress response membrane protein [unclassified Aurantimonas]MCQ8782602.1 GlsB/YeaQ/YmgE family stress response membrane protein [Aurantimonas sp. CSK15Z-1]MCW4114589.1 GlsB/YeaQ/YmgE family stress response membrane protein [Aurantimonas sp. MSK8Z-1]
MDVNGVGWLTAIIVGGLAGWLAEMFMKSDMGVFMNIILGIVGAVVLNAILAAFGLGYTGWIAYLIIGFIGACILIAVFRMFRGRRTV